MCEYCDDKVHHLKKKPIYQLETNKLKGEVKLSLKKIYVDFYDCSFDFKINNCPMCGRNLSNP